MEDELMTAVQNLIRDLNWVKNDMCYKAPEVQTEFTMARWHPMIMASVENVEKVYHEADNARQNPGGV